MSKKTPPTKGRKSRLSQNVPHILTPDPNFRLTGVSPIINFQPPGFEYPSQQAPQQHPNNPFSMNRPFVPPQQNIHHQQQQQSYSRRSNQSMYGSHESVYRPTMDSSTSSYSNYQEYSPVNRINLEGFDFDDQLYNNPNFYAGTGSGYPAQEYHGSGTGSAHGSYHDSINLDDVEEEECREETSPVKPKKRATKAKKKAVEKEGKNDSVPWTKEDEIALCNAWCDVSENSVTGNNQNARGFWLKVIAYFEKEVGAERTYNSIVTKWKNRVRPRVGHFCAIYNNAVRNYRSGENDLTVYTRACDEYQVVCGHPFVLEHCWKILRDHSAWKDNEMPAFLSQDEGHKKARTSTDSDVHSDVPSFVPNRPTGRDAAKKNKKKSSESSKDRIMEGVAEKWGKIKSVAFGQKKELADLHYGLKQKELEQRQIELELQRQREAREDKKLALEERKVELEAQKKYDADLMFYCTPIDPSLPAIERQTMQKLKEAIKARHNL